MIRRRKTQYRLSRSCLLLLHSCLSCHLIDTFRSLVKSKFTCYRLPTYKRRIGLERVPHVWYFTKNPSDSTTHSTRREKKKTKEYRTLTHSEGENLCRKFLRPTVTYRSLVKICRILVSSLYFQFRFRLLQGRLVLILSFEVDRRSKITYL